MNWRDRNLDFTILRSQPIQMKPLPTFQLNKHFSLIFGILFLISCSKDRDPELRLNGIASVQKVSSYDEPIPNSCSETSEKISIPSSLSANKKLSNGSHFEYCIQFSGDTISNKINRTAMSLGYIDNFPVV